MEQSLKVGVEQLLFQVGGWVNSCPVVIKHKLSNNIEGDFLFCEKSTLAPPKGFTIPENWTFFLYRIRVALERGILYLFLDTRTSSHQRYLHAVM